SPPGMGACSGAFRPLSADLQRRRQRLEQIYRKTQLDPVPLNAGSVYDPAGDFSRITATRAILFNESFTFNNPMSLVGNAAGVVYTWGGINLLATLVNLNVTLELNGFTPATITGLLFNPQIQNTPGTALVLSLVE